MTKAEALIYLPMKSNDNLDDIYETELFSFKQYFIQKPPLAKLLNSKLKKLSKINEAFIELGGELNREPFAFQLPIFTNNVKETINLFFQSQSQIKLAIQNTDNGIKLLEIIHSYLELMRFYVQMWNTVDVGSIEGVKAVQEPNPMELMAAVGDFESQGRKLFAEINKMNEEHLLIQEAKRLYLWNKLDTDVR